MKSSFQVTIPKHKMGKSIRNKAGRKCRNVNREHFMKKELQRLYKSVAVGEKELAENIKWRSEKKKLDAEAKEEIPEIKEEDNVSQDGLQTLKDASMDVDKAVPVYDKVTKRDQNGHYPPWMNQKAIRKHKKRLGNTKKKGKPKMKSLKW